MPPVRYDSERLELQLQQRVWQAELALAKVRQEEQLAPVHEATAPVSPDFGGRCRTLPAERSLSPIPKRLQQHTPRPGSQKLQGSASPEFRQRVDALRSRLHSLQSLPSFASVQAKEQEQLSLEALENLKSELLEVQSQACEAREAEVAEMTSADRSEDAEALQDAKIKLALEAENKELLQRLRQTELVTHEAAEAQMEADEQIDADFRNLEEKLQAEIEDVAQAGLQLEEHWFHKVEQLQQELSEATQATRATADPGAENQLILEKSWRAHQLSEVQDLQKELHEAQEISSRLASSEARAREEYQLQEEQKERFRRAQEQVQTKVQDLQNELKEEKQISRRFATEEVAAKRKSMARLSEMQSQKQDFLEQIAKLQQKLEDEKQVGKLLASQRMVAAKVQANVTQEMEEMTQQEAARSEHLRQQLLAESNAWAEDLLDLRCDLELRAAAAAPRRGWSSPRARPRGVAMAEPKSMDYQLEQLELSLKRWEAQTRARRQHDKDLELRLHAQLLHAETKAMRFKGGQELAEERVMQLRSELEEAPSKDELQSALLLEAAAAAQASLLEEELHAQSLSQAADQVSQLDDEEVLPSPSKTSSDKELVEDKPMSKFGGWRKSWAPGRAQELDQESGKEAKLPAKRQTTHAEIATSNLTPQSSHAWRPTQAAPEITQGSHGTDTARTRRSLRKC